MIYFHDYLIAYKQTPRSRMFKRYKPPMDQILECDSVDEQTQASMSIVMSQRNSALPSLGGSIYSNNQMKKSAVTFKYNDRAELGNDAEHVSSSDDSSS